MTAPPASTVTETKVVYLWAHDSPPRPTIKLQTSVSFVRRAMPTEDIEEAEKERRIVDVNKPEMQM